MRLIVELMRKYKSFIAYAVFGVLTTIVNIVVYNIGYYELELGNTISNIIAWIFAVVFAYVTNKVWVFDSKSWELQVLKKEILTFVGCRLATGVMDILIMFICVDFLGLHAMLMKVLSNILVIILNYVFSKLVIFKKR